MKHKVIVVGAGIIGSSIAWRLAEKGYYVVLADAGKLGGEASSAAAGMLTVGAEFPAGDPLGAMALTSLALYPQFVSQLEAASGVKIEYNRCGGLQLATTEEEWNELRQQATSQRANGIPSRELTALELAEHIPGPAVGGMFFDDDAVVAPRDLVRALRAACLRIGVEILEDTPVQELHTSGEDVSVRLKDSTLTGTAAVLSSGAWSSSLGVFTPKVADLSRAFPVRGHVVSFRAKPGILRPILRHGSTYVLQRADGQILAGSTEEDCGFNRTPDMGLVQDIHRRAAQLLPALATMEPDDHWIGFRPATESRLPEIHQMGSAPVWLAYGHYRNGILLAPATSQRITDEISASLGMPSRG